MEYKENTMEKLLVSNLLWRSGETLLYLFVFAE